MRKRGATYQLAWSGLGAGVGLGVSVVSRAIVTAPLWRLALTGAIGTVLLVGAETTPRPFKHAALGTLVVSGLLDVVHAFSRVQYADAPGSGVGSLEAELARATVVQPGAPVAAA